MEVARVNNGNKPEYYLGSRMSQMRKTGAEEKKRATDQSELTIVKT